jgi:hypothetical protein
MTLPTVAAGVRTEPTDRRMIVAAIVYRAFPAGAYAVYAGALSRFAPGTVAIARAFFFVFGFVHMRMMSREARLSSVVEALAVLSFWTIIVATPLQLLTGAGVPSGRQALNCAALSFAASALFAAFLIKYSGFLRPTESSGEEQLSLIVPSDK